MISGLLALSLFAAIPAPDDDLPPPLPGSEQERPPSLDEGEEEGDDEGDDEEEGDGEEEGGPGFVERYFPLAFNDDLDPLVEDNLLLFIIGGFLGTLGGQIWIPALAMKRTPPKGYYKNAFFIWAAHYAVNLLPLLLLPCVCVPYVGAVVFAIVWFLNLGCLLANTYYLIPVAVANEYDRLLKAEGGSGDDDDEALRFRAPPAALGSYAVSY